MTIIKKAVAVASLACLFSLPAHADGYHRHSGISINIGSPHSGISLNYHAPKQYSYDKKYYKNKTSHNGINLNYRTPKQYKYNKKQYKSKASHHKYAKISPYSYHHYKKHYKAPYGQYKRHDKYRPNQYQQVKIISQSCQPISQRIVNRYGYYETIITKQCYDRVVQVPKGRYTRH